MSASRSDPESPDESLNSLQESLAGDSLGLRYNLVETRNMTIDRLLKEYELCDVAGRLSIIEHAISQLRCRICPVCTLRFFDENYRVIPCLCRMHTDCYEEWKEETRRPRKCPRCTTVIVDEDDLWDLTKLRQNQTYLYGSNISDEVNSEERSDDSGSEYSPRNLFPKVKVPPQSPRRRSKAKVGKLRRSLTDGDLHNLPRSELMAAEMQELSHAP
jgi:hypothetical protein